MSYASVTPAPADSRAHDELRLAVGRFLSDPDARADPVTLFRRLVREAPILKLGPMWLVSGFDEVTELSGRPEVRSFPFVRGRLLPVTAVPSLAGWVALMLPLRDGADHHRLRSLAATAFGARRLAKLEQLIEDVVDSVLERAFGCDNVDVVRDIALPLPVAVSAAMLDIPTGDRSQVSEWAMLVRQQLLRYEQTADEIGLVERQLDEFAAYVLALCDARRKRPGDDLVSDLAVAADAGQLTSDELVAFVLMLFVNGLDTLTAGLTMAIWELFNHPGERVAVACDRARARAQLDETLRLHTPVRFSARTLAADVVLAGNRLQEGDVVTLCFSAANRDPRRFHDPDRFEPMRRERHVAFGHGPHHCLGATLSQTVGAIVLERIARRGSSLTTHVTADSLAWSPSVAYTTLSSFPLQVGKSPSTTT